ENLLKALVQTGKPIVLVLFNGRPLILNWENQHLSAILDAWFGGTEAGNAIADVLFGNYNPSGKLSMTFPLNQGQIPIYYNAKNTGRPFHVGDGPKFKSDYLDMPNEPLYPFGFGLSYTKFSYSAITIDNGNISVNQPVHIKVTVTNTGNFDGEETVQLYIRDMVASVTQPVKELKKFQKVYLKKGESKEASFTLSTNDLTFVNSDLKWVYEPGAFKIFVGGNSRDVVEANLLGK
ncbi:MAG TPA: glycoside hydrolase family 3 C-terminal domain-containing protein, partial [Puia sp.]|nr:glycoside hydrolase family 3 C-terminal domain-containing protein [Puia sp.]